MGANIYKKRGGFIATYDCITRVIGAGQFNNEVYNELQKIIPMHVICEFQIMHTQICLQIIGNGAYPEIITKYHEQKDNYFYCAA